MSHSYSSNRVHLVFSTKNRVKCIPVTLQTKLWSYMAGIARNHGFEAIKIGGVEDHAHALLILPQTMPLSKVDPNHQGVFIEMAERHYAELCLAGRIWRVQRERFTNRRCDQVH